MNDQTELALNWGGFGKHTPEATQKNLLKTLNAAIDAAQSLKDHVETITCLLTELTQENKEHWKIRSTGYAHATEDAARSVLRMCLILKENLQ